MNKNYSSVSLAYLEQLYNGMDHSCEVLRVGYMSGRVSVGLTPLGFSSDPSPILWADVIGGDWDNNDYFVPCPPHCGGRVESKPLPVDINGLGNYLAAANVTYGNDDEGFVDSARAYWGEK